MWALCWLGTLPGRQGETADLNRPMYEPENEENHRKQKRSARRFGANKEDLKEDLKG